MDSKILLGRILQKLIDKGYSQVEFYNRFTYIKHTNRYVEVGREKGANTKIYFEKILIVIEAYLNSPEDYNKGPSFTRKYGITHVNSPVWTLAHLLEKKDYE